MSGRIPETFIQDLLNRVDIADLVGARVPLKRAGAEYKACCPFHDEKTPSFTVSPSKQFYHCFGCGAHGTVISFLMEYDGLDFVEAVEELASQCGLEVPRGDATKPPQPGHRDGATIIELQERASRYFQQQLRRHDDAPRVVAYLKERGVSGETAATFRLGFAPSGWNNLLSAFAPGSDNRLVDAGLAIRRDSGGSYDRFRNRLIFPILDSRGRTVGFGGRALGDDTPKYLNSPETAAFHKGRELYGLHQALKKDRHPRRAVVVEGYMDVIALAQAGVPCPVATLGTAPTREHLQRLFRVTDRVVFCFDGDTAGRRAARRAMEIALSMLREGRRVEFAFLPDGEDPDSQVRKGDGTTFEAFLDQATPLSEFLFTGLLDQTDLHSLDGRARLVELARPLLSKVPVGAMREMLLTRTAELAGLSSDQVRHMLTAADRATATPRQRPPGPPRRDRPPPAFAPLVAKALRLLLAEPRCADQLADLALPVLDELPGIDLLNQAIGLFRNRSDATAATLLEHYRGMPEAALLTELTHQSPGGVDSSIQHSARIETPDDIAREFRDALDAIRRLAMRRQHRELTEKKSVTALTEKEKAALRSFRKETMS